MISTIIEILQKGEYYGAGKHVEIAKGKNEIVLKWSEIKEKLKRQRKA
jgi:hypothetical protein